MSTFSGRYPANTFKNLLNIDNSNAGIDATLRTIQDGEGTTCPLQLSSSGVNITSGFTYNSNAVSFGGAFSSAGAVTWSGAYAVTVTLTGTTTVTFPTSGTLYGTATGSITSAALAGSLSDETGSGSAVFATSPTLVTPILGTPTSGTLTNCTGLPISTGVSGLGTGIATALAVNTGSAGAPVLFNGALGTPTSGTATNLSGTAASLTAGNATTAAALTNGGTLNTPGSGTLTNCTGLPESGITGSAWTNFTPAWTGFVDNNIGVTVARYKKIGNTCYIVVSSGTSGTSNATTFTMTGLPFTAGAGGTTWFRVTATNNSAGIATAEGSIATGGTTVVFSINQNSSGWTSSGGKSVFFECFYETT